ncbi:MAG TPA: SGNH/GDSL hydrolase family protein [Cyclobacteriaceae bacterium]|nr:SGNH/GDSL hydrolase family protein [Cyclobacteriaceae bacterium]
MKPISQSLILFLTLLSFYAMSQTPIKYLALGDSYTIGESVAENERWPVQLAEVLRKKGRNIEGPKIIATTGWRTDNLKNAINIAKLKNEYGLVSLLIGVNNQYQGKPIEQFKVEFEDLLKTSIQLAGGKKENVFVVSIPDYGYTPYGKPKQQQISKEIDEYNAIIKETTGKYGVAYYYITDISRKGLNDPGLVAEDGLHPSGKMYSEWVDLIAQGL